MCKVAPYHCWESFVHFRAFSLASPSWKIEGDARELLHLASRLGILAGTSSWQFRKAEARPARSMVDFVDGKLLRHVYVCLSSWRMTNGSSSAAPLQTMRKSTHTHTHTCWISNFRDPMPGTDLWQCLLLLCWLHGIVHCIRWQHPTIGPSPRCWSSGDLWWRVRNMIILCQGSVTKRIPWELPLKY